ncbi:MAG: twin-arginine translocation signal domain-containing protein, partial [Vicinamibacterales bacterium]
MSADQDPRSGDQNPSSDQSLSRRDVLKHGAAAVAGGAALFSGAPAFGQAPAVQTNTQAGRRYRAYVTLPGTRGRTIETVTLRALQPNQVLVRVQAAQACYTITNLLNPPAPPAAPPAGAAGAAPPPPNA